MGRSLTKRIESDSSLVSFPRRFDGRVTVWCNRSEYSKWFEWIGVSWATIRFVSFNVGRNLGEIGAQDFMLRLHEIHHPSIRALYLPSIDGISKISKKCRYFQSCRSFVFFLRKKFRRVFSKSSKYLQILTYILNFFETRDWLKNI